MKGSPKSSLRPFLHRALQLYVFFLFFAISYTANRKKMQDPQSQTLPSLRGSSFRVFERNFKQYNERYLIPWSVKKELEN